MGLDARVRCNCIRDGKTKPFPYPGRLGFDQCGEPTLVGESDSTLEELNSFDRWVFDPGCEHHGFVVELRIGNLAYVGHVRSWVKETERHTGRKFPVVSEMVVYSGSHAGDCIGSQDAELLRNEIEELGSHTTDKITSEFIDSMKQLCDASLATGNPILF
jgi:hypothetical protein